MLPAIFCLGKSRLAITVEAECLTEESGNITISINTAMDSSHGQEEYYEILVLKKSKKKCYEKDIYGHFLIRSQIRLYFDNMVLF